MLIDKVLEKEKLSVKEEAIMDTLEFKASSGEFKLTKRQTEAIVVIKENPGMRHGGHGHTKGNVSFVRHPAQGVVRAVFENVDGTKEYFSMY